MSPVNYLFTVTDHVQLEIVRGSAGHLHFICLCLMVSFALVPQFDQGPRCLKQFCCIVRAPLRAPTLVSSCMNLVQMMRSAV